MAEMCPAVRQVRLYVFRLAAVNRALIFNASSVVQHLPRSHESVLLVYNGFMHGTTPWSQLLYSLRV